MQACITFPLEYNIHLMSARHGNSSFCCAATKEISTTLIQQSYFMPKSKKFYSINKFKIKRNLLKLFQQHILLFVVYFFVFYILCFNTNLTCFASIVFILCRRAGNNFSLIALGIHCIYLKPRDHESANHI